MFAVSSRCKNDSQLCFKCLRCLDSQIMVLLQWYLSVFVLFHEIMTFYVHVSLNYIKYSFYMTI